jgi:hypothetical protein
MYVGQSTFTVVPRYPDSISVRLRLERKKSLANDHRSSTAQLYVIVNATDPEQLLLLVPQESDRGVDDMTDWRCLMVGPERPNRGANGGELGRRRARWPGRDV